MSRQSLTMRKHLFSERSAEVEVTLVEISGLDGGPYRFSSDTTELLSAEEKRWGTRSNGEEYDFLLMESVWPDDQAGVPRTATIVLTDLLGNMGQVLRAITFPTRVTLKSVLASRPDQVEFEMRNMKIPTGRLTQEGLELQLTRGPNAARRLPAHRQTPSRFPAIHG